MIGDERWRREFECEFISFDETLINPVFLNEKLTKMGKEPESVTGTVRWYAPIQPNRIYLVGLDPSMGTGDDPAAIQIFQLPELIQVGEWRHNRTPIRGQVKTMMDILQHIQNEMVNSGRQSGDTEIYWSVENNTLGEAALVVIEDTGEDNFPGVFLTESKVAGNRRVRKGFNTSPKKKLEACSRMKSLIEEEKMKINSKALVRELKFFVAKGNTYKAKEGEHDDLVMATTLITRMLDEMIHWDGDLMEELSRSIGLEDESMEPMPSVLL